MRINFAHVRDRSTNGSWIDFAVFEANSADRTNIGRSKVLQRLTLKARASGLKVDKAALAFKENGRIQFYGSPDLVDYLANGGLPDWTHSLED
jgi:hypothetical protein